MRIKGQAPRLANYLPGRRGKPPWRFDTRHPDGADYVIVPAMSRDDDPAVLKWIKSQTAKGAIIISVCAGAKILGAAGLPDGRRAATHWSYLERPGIELAPGVDEVSLASSRTPGREPIGHAW